MQALTKKRLTEKQVEVRFRGTPANLMKLRRMAQALKVMDVTEWELEEKETYRELTILKIWNTFSINGRQGLTTQKQNGHLPSSLGIINFL